MYYVDDSHLQNVYHIPYDIQSIKSTSYFFINFRDTTCWWMLREGILKNIKFVHCSKTLTPALGATPPHASQGPARQGIAGRGASGQMHPGIFYVLNATIARVQVVHGFNPIVLGR